MAVFPQSDAPLQGNRVGAISFTATSKALPSIPDWLRAWRGSRATWMPFRAASAGGHGYTAEVLMHINGVPSRSDSTRTAPKAPPAADGTQPRRTAAIRSTPGRTSPTDADTATDGEGN